MTVNNQCSVFLPIAYRETAHKNVVSAYGQQKHTTRNAHHEINHLKDYIKKLTNI